MLDFTTTEDLRKERALQAQTLRKKLIAEARTLRTEDELRTFAQTLLTAGFGPGIVTGETYSIDKRGSRHGPQKNIGNFLTEAGKNLVFETLESGTYEVRVYRTYKYMHERKRVRVEGPKSDR